MPDRYADTVASWLERYPGIEIIARDGAGVYAESARRGEPDATQVADHWHLLQNLGEALRQARRTPSQGGQRRWKAITSEKVGNDDARPEQPVETSPKLDCLRQSRRNQRSEFYAEILQLRETGPSPRQIEPRIGLNIRTVERWLPASGEPEHRRPPSRSVLMGPFRDYLEKGLGGRPAQQAAAVDRN